MIADPSSFFIALMVNCAYAVRDCAFAYVFFALLLFCDGCDCFDGCDGRVAFACVNFDRAVF